MNLLIIIPAFLVAIGVLVTVHEFGHFWVARRLGVKVLRFSIGFGRPLLRRISRDADKVEYVLSALPFGGYVKMLDERECEEGYVIPAEELPRAFNRQPLWKRAAIVVAGPVANFLLAVVVYALVFMVGQDAMRPYVDVSKGSPAAQAGFQPGDLVTAINGVETPSWEDMRMLLVEEYLKSPQLLFNVNTPDGAQVQRHLDLQNVLLFKEESGTLDKVGINPWLPPYDVVVHGVLPDTPAAQAGLQAKDKILRMNDVKPAGGRDFIMYIQSHAKEPVTLQIERAGQQLATTVTPSINPQTGAKTATIGAQLESPPKALLDKVYFIESFGPVESIWRGAAKTWQMSVVTLKLMGRMLTGEVNLKNISGPVTIAQFAGLSASIGLTYYLGFLAIVSVSLGVLNLLPIPMLDGGHLLYYLIELIKGSPVSAETEAVGFRVGMAIIAGLMMLALYNDFTRLLN
ncbi:RIP metalloprotease RseP [Candidatus Thiothrix sp. Deng01]|uniref:Zinc metalloprotease n=1 Tax=Candidatus Thiothrix phosphatis TaxID=3112415 RepID=A0ABU6CYE6_9GAMM|nr:RIP metalloprotease RseP [Candidatus Thiothrix sp. Deng01]MEB4591865.1 RIP metalloprotease RseP [Candidatus Thiothrix sp. Deng01]